jgi:hypothetical protein
MSPLRQKSLYVAIAFILSQNTFAATETLNEVLVNDTNYPFVYEPGRAAWLKVQAKF